MGEQRRHYVSLVKEPDGKNTLYEILHETNSKVKFRP